MPVIHGSDAVVTMATDLPGSLRLPLDPFMDASSSLCRFLKKPVSPALRLRGARGQRVRAGVPSFLRGGNRRRHRTGLQRGRGTSRVRRTPVRRRRFGLVRGLWRDGRGFGCSGDALRLTPVGGSFPGRRPPRTPPAPSPPRALLRRRRRVPRRRFVTLGPTLSVTLGRSLVSRRPCRRRPRPPRRGERRIVPRLGLGVFIRRRRIRRPWDPSNVPLARRFAPSLTGGGVNRKRPVPAEPLKPAPPPFSLSAPDSFPSLSLAVASHSFTALPPASCISLSHSPGDLMYSGMFAAAAAILSSTVRLRLSSDSEDTDGASRGGDHIFRPSPLLDEAASADPPPDPPPSRSGNDVFRDLKTSHSGSGFTSGSTGLGFPAMFHTVGSSFSRRAGSRASSIVACRSPRASRRCARG